MSAHPENYDPLDLLDAESPNYNLRRTMLDHEAWLRRELMAGRCPNWVKPVRQTNRPRRNHPTEAQKIAHLEYCNAFPE